MGIIVAYRIIDGMAICNHMGREVKVGMVGCPKRVLAIDPKSYSLYVPNRGTKREIRWAKRVIKFRDQVGGVDPFKGVTCPSCGESSHYLSQECFHCGSFLRWPSND